MIYVTKSFLPPVKLYKKYIDNIWKTNQITNQGPLLKELENKLKKYLDVKYLHFLSNGTVALQLALDALNIKNGEIITTPFSYVATTSSILWERCSPVFVDIEPDNFTIDVSQIEKKITKKTKAILAVHVFGYACDVDGIQKIAKKYNLKVIYDGAHAFGSKYEGKSLLDYGDITTCSFHATKLFHTVEGGCCITKDKKTSDKLELAKRFGHNYDRHLQIGINAKNSEFHAAMGLANFLFIDEIINERKKISKLYDKLLPEIQKPKKQENLEYNYAYYPVIFKNEKQLLNVISRLNKENIFPRRYFYPSLNNLPYMAKKQSCRISEDIAKRICCLPLYCGLKEKEIRKISGEVKRSV